MKCNHTKSPLTSSLPTSYWTLCYHYFVAPVDQRTLSFYSELAFFRFALKSSSDAFIGTVVSIHHAASIKSSVDDLYPPRFRSCGAPAGFKRSFVLIQKIAVVYYFVYETLVVYIRDRRWC